MANPEVGWVTGPQFKSRLPASRCQSIMVDTYTGMYNRLGCQFFAAFAPYANALVDPDAARRSRHASFFAFFSAASFGLALALFSFLIFFLSESVSLSGIFAVVEGAICAHARTHTYTCN